MRHNKSDIVSRKKQRKARIEREKSKPKACIPKCTSFTTVKTDKGVKRTCNNCGCSVTEVGRTYA